MAIKISQMKPKAFEDVEKEGYIPVAITDEETFKVSVSDLPKSKHEWDIQFYDNSLVIWDEKAG